MLFKSIRVRGYRSIEDSGVLPLGPVTVITGRNNAGKSALLRAAYLPQGGALRREGDIRIGSDQASVDLEFDDLPLPITNHLNEKNRQANQGRPGVISFILRRPTGQKLVLHTEGNAEVQLQSFSNREPDNLVFPVLSGRRVTYYQEQTTRDQAMSVTPQDSNLVSRVLMLSGSKIPEAVQFRRMCNDILQISLDVLPDQNGQQFLGVQVNRFDSIPLEAMGAGLSGALSLIIGLSTAHSKLFIIEEPEDDLHPEALKCLLDAIVEASVDNQFLITTHSSIVLTRLANVSGAVFLHVKGDQGLPPRSTFETVRSSSDRIAVLQDLGYRLADLDLGDGWLIFEESSAERLIRQWLIPWFAPGLRKLRTLAARGTSRVRPLMDDFREMFLFAHLEPIYRYRAWVIVDGDPTGISVVDRLRADFKGWPASRFQHLSRHFFEQYYPPRFAEPVQALVKLGDRRRQRAAKEELLNEVLSWIEEDEGTARGDFEVSAAEVIVRLREIESQLKEI